jgi:hypothetical protein
MRHLSESQAFDATLRARTRAAGRPAARLPVVPTTLRPVPALRTRPARLAFKPWLELTGKTLSPANRLDLLKQYSDWTRGIVSGTREQTIQTTGYAVQA